MTSIGAPPSNTRVFASSKVNNVPSLPLTVQTTRLSAVLASIDPPIDEPKAWRKLLRAPESSDNPSDPVKPRASAGKFAATAVLSTEPPVINLLMG